MCIRDSIPATRGEYGPGKVEDHVSRITALALEFKAHHVERTQPSGRTHLIQGEPLFIDGQLSGFITTYTDITEQKKTEDALRAQHDLLQTVIESIPSAISLFDRDKNLVLHNQELLRLLDFPPSLIEAGPVTLEAIFRFNAERGEYGPGDIEAQVRARVELSKKCLPHQLERARPDGTCLLYTSPSPRDRTRYRMPSSA